MDVLIKVQFETSSGLQLDSTQEIVLSVIDEASEHLIFWAAVCKVYGSEYVFPSRSIIHITYADTTIKVPAKNKPISPKEFLDLFYSSTRLSSKKKKAYLDPLARMPVRVDRICIVKADGSTDWFQAEEPELVIFFIKERIASIKGYLAEAREMWFFLGDTPFPPILYSNKPKKFTEYRFLRNLWDAGYSKHNTYIIKPFVFTLPGGLENNTVIPVLDCFREVLAYLLDYPRLHKAQCLETLRSMAINAWLHGGSKILDFKDSFHDGTYTFYIFTQDAIQIRLTASILADLSIRQVWLSWQHPADRTFAGNPLWEKLTHIFFNSSLEIFQEEDTYIPPSLQEFQDFYPLPEWLENKNIDHYISLCSLRDKATLREAVKQFLPHFKPLKTALFGTVDTWFCQEHNLFLAKVLHPDKFGVFFTLFYNTEGVNCWKFHSFSEILEQVKGLTAQEEDS